MAFRPLMATGAALTSAVAIVVAAPTILPNAADKTIITTPSAFAVPSTPHPTSDYYEQMEVTVPGLLDAFFKGYGNHGPGDKSAACAFCPAELPAASNHSENQPPPTAQPFAPAADVTESAALDPAAVVVIVPLRWGNVREAIVEATELVRGFLSHGPIGAIRVIVRWVTEGLYRQPEAPVVTATDLPPGTDGVDEVGQRSEEPKPEAPKSDPPGVSTPPSQTPEQKEPAPRNDRVGADKRVEVSHEPAPAKATIDDSDEETKTRSQLRREVIKERLQERREDVKERRETAKERRAEIKQRVSDAVKRFTGGDTDTDSDSGGTDTDTDTDTGSKKDSTDPGE